MTYIFKQQLVYLGISFGLRRKKSIVLFQEVPPKTMKSITKIYITINLFIFKDMDIEGKGIRLIFGWK